MAKISWYKRDPDAALQGMFELTLEERGAYNTVLDLIYARAGNLPDDDRFIAGWMRVDLRVWKRIKGRLIDLGKLYLEDGLIRNRRADAEVLSTLSRCLSLSELNATKGRKSGEVRRKNKALAEPTVEPGTNTTTTTTRYTDSESTGEAEVGGVGGGAPSPPAQASRPKNGSRLPEQWAPSDIDIAFAQRHGLNPATVAENFRDYWTAKAGQQARKVDWAATWRTWCRRESERVRGQRPQQRPDKSIVHAGFRAAARLRQRGM